MLLIISCALLIGAIIYAVKYKETWPVIIGILAVMVTLVLAHYEEPDYRKELSKVPVDTVVYDSENDEYIVLENYGNFHVTETYKAKDLNIIDSDQRNFAEFVRYHTDHWIIPWDREERGVSTLRFPLGDVENIE